MIICLISEENKNLLERLAELYEEDLLIEVMDRGSLYGFIEERLQVIPNLQYMILERSCIKENDQKLAEVLDTIRAVWDTKFIILEEELRDEQGEQQMVIYNEHITTLYKYQDNLENNLEYLLKGEKIPAEHVYNGIWIGIMSANSGAGATHIAIDLAMFIHNLGESVCYVEANESGDLGALAKYYNFEMVGENHYRNNEIDYWHQSIDPEKKFAVLDLGKYSASKQQLFDQCKIKILITDGQPYRMADALNVLRYIRDDNTRLWINFIEQKEYDALCEKRLADLPNLMGRITWHKGMFHGVDALYPEVMKEYVNVNTGRQSRFSILLNPDNLKEKLQRRNSLKQEKKNPDISEEPEPLEEIINIIPDNEVKEEEVTNIIPEDVKEEEIEEPVELVKESEQPEQPHKKLPVKNLVILLLAGTALLGMLSAAPDIRKFAENFFFNNQQQVPEATELVDEELNINQDIKISVLEVEGADGYEVSYSMDKDFDKKTTVVVEVETADKAVETLTAGKTYYVRVRAFKYNEDGTKVYGEYTEVQKIET